MRDGIRKRYRAQFSTPLGAGRATHYPTMDECIAFARSEVSRRDAELAPRLPSVEELADVIGWALKNSSKSEGTPPVMVAAARVRDYLRVYRPTAPEKGGV